jgi:protein TonB
VSDAQRAPEPARETGASGGDEDGMTTDYEVLGPYLLFKRFNVTPLGELWRGGELNGDAIRHVWLQRFAAQGVDRSEVESIVERANRLSALLKGHGLPRGAAYAVDGGQPIAIWDHSPGRPLHCMLEAAAPGEGPLPTASALLLTQKVARALVSGAAATVDGKPVTHGHLTPSTVLVCSDGEVIVWGFGCAAALASSPAAADLREAAAPYRPSPGGPGRTAAAVDAFALGALLWHLLSGSPLPVDAAARARTLTDGFSAAQEVPQGVLSLLRKALAERTEDGYATVAELKRDLDELLLAGEHTTSTLDLAVNLDRLFRREHEEDELELARERALDAAVCRNRRAAAAAAATAPLRRSRLPLFLGAGSLVTVAVVASLLLVPRAPLSEANRNGAATPFEALVRSEVDRQLKEREAQLRAELQAQATRAAEARQELESQRQAAAAGQVDPAAQRRIEAAEREVARQEALQREREAELARLEDESERAAAPASAVASVPPVVPTAAPELPDAVSPRETMAPSSGAEPLMPAGAGEPVTTVPGEGEASPQLTASSVVAAGATTGVSPQEAPAGAVRAQRLTKLHDVSPVYPMMARQARVQGSVVLELVITADGRVNDTKVLRGLPMGLTEAAIEAARQWRYEPMQVNGRSVEALLVATVRFSL